MKSLLNHADIRKTPAIYVEWTDSAAIRGWHHEATFLADASPTKIVSIGYLLKETEDFVSITTSIADTGSAMDVLSIPKVAITRRKKLKT